MEDFKTVLNDKESSCVKCDKVYIEFDSASRSDVDCTELKNLIDSFNIPREPISGTIHIKRNSSNYKNQS